MKSILLCSVIVVFTGVVFGQDATDGAYENATYGFRLAPPTFPKATTKNSTVAMFVGPPENSFATNLVVNVQEFEGSIVDWSNLARTQFTQSGLKVRSSKLFTQGKADAFEFVYEGRLDGRDLEFLAWGIKRGNRVYLLTCTCLKGELKSQEARLRKALTSFSFTN